MAMLQACDIVNVAQPTAVTCRIGDLWWPCWRRAACVSFCRCASSQEALRDAGLIKSLVSTMRQLFRDAGELSRIALLLHAWLGWPAA